MTPAPPGDVLLDRDGVIVRNRAGYVRSPEQLELLPGSAEAIRRLRAGGHRVIVVTNQSVVGRRLVSRSTLDDIHARLCEMVAGDDGGIDAVFVCPHHPDDGCACRKPQPGLLFAARDHANVDLDTAVFIGDAPSDVEAARAAACRAIRIDAGAAPGAPGVAGDVPTVPDLAAAVDLLLGAPVSC